MPIFFKILRNDREYFCQADDEPEFYLGRQVHYKNRVGLKNDHDGITRDYRFNPGEYRSTYGFWADFIGPTAKVESNSSFVVLNTYDRAAFTFGFPQFAAHVPGGDFVLFFRAMLERAEAHEYFPNLIVKKGTIHSVETLDEVELENKDSTEKLQKYLNQASDIVDDREVIAAAKFVHWTINYPQARELQVQHATNLARRIVERIDRRVGLNGQPAAICCVAFDLLHHGRGGDQVFPRIDAALKASDPLEALLAIGEEGYAERVKGLRRQLKDSEQFEGKRWASASLDFV
ncbi:hypothetical protein [Rhizobium leguminosarum]|uniref:hypothetical protein n=1 Tax=Rhizobium leguminosarum TaxID=384 RepID=UPI001440F3CF|nr:hypothetical protein [Rhizobium leguminosarum]NKL66291.1 hypothetical protein [Rhizobium leguminosarum bv. viciae]